MRKPLDRIRHAVFFELIALLLVIPGGALLFGIGLKEMGVIGVGSAFIATAWNYVYNWGFDHALKRRTGTTLKTPGQRVFHAVAFEAGLLLFLAPFIAWRLQVTLWEAVLMDVGLAAFYLVYAYAYNWAYDRLFPLPEWAAEQAAQGAIRNA